MVILVFLFYYNNSNNLEHKSHLKQDVNHLSYAVWAAAVLYLLMRGGTKLFSLLGRDGGGHVERQHQLIVAELLVELQLGHEAVGERGDGLDAMLQLTVTEVVQQLTHLKRPEMQEKTFRCKSFSFSLCIV